jgi:hypothetical protein
MSPPTEGSTTGGLPLGSAHWQQQICRQLRRIDNAADPDVEETIKRRVQPYFVLPGNVRALPATTDGVPRWLRLPHISDVCAIR